VSFTKEYYLSLRLLQCEEDYLCAKEPCFNGRKKHCFSCKRCISVRSKRVKHLVKHYELSYLLNGILPTLSVFRGRKINVLLNSSFQGNGGIL
jgi:hypothetical protein